jgi:hypothetical protein
MGRSTFSGPVRSKNGFEFSESGTQITNIVKGSVSVDPASIAANAMAVVDVAVVGAAVGDVVVMIPPADLTAGLLNGAAYVSAADQISVPIANMTAAPIDEAAADWSYIIIKS